MAYPAKAQWAGIVKWLVEEGAESERNDILKQMIDDGTIKKIAESYGINADISMGDN